MRNHVNYFSMLGPPTEAPSFPAPELHTLYMKTVNGSGVIDPMNDSGFSAMFMRVNPFKLLLKMRIGHAIYYIKEY